MPHTLVQSGKRVNNLVADSHLLLTLRPRIYVPRSGEEIVDLLA